MPTNVPNKSINVKNLPDLHLEYKKYVNPPTTYYVEIDNSGNKTYYYPLFSSKKDALISNKNIKSFEKFTFEQHPCIKFYMPDATQLSIGGINVSINGLNPPETSLNYKKYVNPIITYYVEIKNKYDANDNKYYYPLFLNKEDAINANEDCSSCGQMENIKLPDDDYIFKDSSDNTYRVESKNNGNKLIISSPFYKSNVLWDSSLNGYPIDPSWNDVTMLSFTNNTATIHDNSENQTVSLSPQITTSSFTFEQHPGIEFWMPTNVPNKSIGVYCLPQSFLEYKKYVNPPTTYYVEIDISGNNRYYYPLYTNKQEARFLNKNIKYFEKFTFAQHPDVGFWMPDISSASINKITPPSVSLNYKKYVNPVIIYYVKIYDNCNKYYYPLFLNKEDAEEAAKENTGLMDVSSYTFQQHPGIEFWMPDISSVSINSTKSPDSSLKFKEYEDVPVGYYVEIDNSGVKTYYYPLYVSKNDAAILNKDTKYFEKITFTQHPGIEFWMPDKCDTSSNGSKHPFLSANYKSLVRYI
jgi:hypothetical protein